MELEQPARNNVAILLTPPGAAAIATIRIRGPRVRQFLSAHFSRPIADARCIHGELSDEGRVVDDVVVVQLPGVSGADLNVHGGSWVVRSVLELARRAGFEVVEQANAPLNDDAVEGETILDRELHAHLPLARTELALRTLLDQPRRWEKLKRWVAHRSNAKSVEAALRKLLDDQRLQRLLHPPRVAVVGAPNVGKSTLANQLFDQERSITADLPGTTRDWVGEIANIDGLAVMLLDTPGTRETDDDIEKTAIDRSRGEVKRADLVLLLLDASRPLEPEQLPLIEAHSDSLRVANKVDLPHAWDVSKICTCRTVATSGKGVNEVRQSIQERFGVGGEIADAMCWTQRQREVVERAIEDFAALSEI